MRRQAEHFHEPFGRIGLAGDAVRPPHELHVLACGQVVVERRRIGNERHVGALRAVGAVEPPAA